jgi:hypothetical protein
MTERSAATPVGDLLDSRQGLALGLPLAMAITFSAFMAALLVRRWLGGGGVVVRASA